MSDLLEWLKMTVDVRLSMSQKNPMPYVCMEDFVIKEGMEFRAAAYPEHLKQHIGEPKECYRNSVLLLVARDDLVYCEGYGCPDIPIPIVHAWCVTREGVVVDPTWCNTIDLEKAVYHGVPFRRDYVIEQAMKVGCCIDDWRNRWPLLTGEIPKEVWKEELRGEK